ncbi:MULTISPECIES: hypothetical protein [unclassified Sphingomonas]|uniref:hypothetical protein n=1 Tax=Sphingomonas sp. PvP015 TaxID=3156388 RepID=UPI003396D32C
MTRPTAEPSLLEAIPVISLRAYADAHGWKQIDTYGQNNAVLEKADRGEIVIPSTTSYADYAETVSRLLAVWADDEQREQLNVLRDIMQVDQDVIRVRAPHAGLDGSIAIEAGVGMFKNAREMLLAAACAAKEPRRAYRLGSHKEAQDYIETVRLGQTEQGSYIVTLLSPVPAPSEGEVPLIAEDPAYEPFQRRVTTTLVSSLKSAHRIAQASMNGAAASAFDGTVAQGVNANLCDALAALIDEGAGLDISVSWAPLLPSLKKSSTVRFGKDEAKALREGAVYLRSSEPRDVDRLEGYVSAFGRELDRNDGHITLKAVVDGKLSSVQANVPVTVYERAAEAHLDRKTVTVAGKLEKRGQRWHLEGAHNFQIVEELDDHYD